MLSTFDTQGLKQRPFRHVKRGAARPLDPDPSSLDVNLLTATKEARPYFGPLYRAFPGEYTNGMDRAETSLGQTDPGVGPIKASDAHWNTWARKRG